MKTSNISQKFTKKINIFLVVFIVLFVLIICGYVFLKSKNSKADSLEQLTQAFNVENIIDDYDYDGLADWEEEIYKTDPTNPDTDGDGYLDGEEVASGFDPTIPAPNDKLTDEASQKIGEGLDRPAPGNLSQMFGYIMSSQLQAGQMPYINTQDINSIDQNVMDTMDEKVMDAIQKVSTGFLSEFIPPFEKEKYEFKLTPENNLAAIRNYAKEVKEAIGTINACHDTNNRISDLEAIEYAIKNSDFNQIKCLSSSYLQSYERIISIQVPLDWIDIHKDLLKLFWSFHKSYKHLSDYEKDPLRGILIIEKMGQTSELFINTLERMAADIESKQN